MALRPFFTTRIIAAWAFPFALLVVANLFYMCMSWFPNHTYLEWAEARPQCQERLPDLLLDLHDGGDTNTWMTVVADGFPSLCLLATLVACVVTRNLRLWNRFCVTQSFVMVANCLAEQVTVMPSSYGYGRCKAFMGISGPEEDRFSFSPTGSCVAMIWSGHVFHVMLGGYMFGLAMEQRFPALKRRACLGCTGAPLMKSVLVVLLGLFEMVLLVVDKGHYSVDMYLAMLIAMLVFTNSKITYWAHRTNPFLGKGAGALCEGPVHPSEMKRELARLRALLAEAPPPAPRQDHKASEEPSELEAAPRASRDPFYLDRKGVGATAL